MRHRILIVDDDEIFLRPLQRTLEVAGHEVLVAPSGEAPTESGCSLPLPRAPTSRVPS